MQIFPWPYLMLEEAFIESLERGLNASLSRFFVSSVCTFIQRYMHYIRRLKAKRIEKLARAHELFCFISVTVFLRYIDISIHTPLFYPYLPIFSASHSAPFTFGFGYTYRVFFILLLSSLFFFFFFFVITRTQSSVREWRGVLNSIG